MISSLPEFFLANLPVLSTVALFVIGYSGLMAYSWLADITLTEAITNCNRAIGRLMAWTLLAMGMIQFLVVIMRYVFSIGFIWLQESIWYLYGLSFMLGAGYTLLHDDHVRIDVFYRQWPTKTKALINLLGCLMLLLPLMVLTIWVSAGYVFNSWLALEGSTEVAGLPILFLLKTSIWAFALLLAFQAIALAITSWKILCPK